jgi:hypothetical protein
MLLLKAWPLTIDLSIFVGISEFSSVTQSLASVLREYAKTHKKYELLLDGSNKLFFSNPYSLFLKFGIAQKSHDTVPKGSWGQKLNKE